MTNIKVHKGGFVHIDDFRDILDINKISYYTLRVNKDKTLSLKFYDKREKLIKPYGQKA